MPNRISQVHRPPAAIRAVFVALATLAAAGACGEQTVLPTGAPIAGHARATPTVAGADVIVLPTLGGTSTIAADINDAGQVVGSSTTADGRTHAFLWTAAGGMQDLGALGGPSSGASAINEAGQVVGWSVSTDAKSARHAFLWTPDVGMRDLGTLAAAQFSIATGINDNGQVVGNNVVLNFRNRPFLWTSELGMRDLDANSGGWAPASAINNVGEVVGNRRTNNGPPSAYLWSAGQGMQDLGTLDGVATAALAINDAGQVVGSTWLEEQRPRAFLWLAGQGMLDLGTLGGVGTEAFGINDVGQVVGYGTSDNAARHAFIWTARDGMQDLYPLTGMTDGRAINNRGQVVGGDRVATLRFQTPNGAFAAAKGSGFYEVAGPGRIKAHFTFGATFLPGQPTVPNGTAKFWIPGAGVAFESAVIEMVVTSGNRVQFWGAGTLNGAPARFRITAVDGQASGSDGSADAFRIELWDAGGTLVYDTQPGASRNAPLTTAIAGGNIQVRRE